MQPMIAVSCTRVKSPGQKDWNKLDEVFAFNSQQHTDFGCRKWSSQCGVVSGFSIWSSSGFENHVGGTVMFKGGKGSAIDISAKKKLNAENSTAAAPVGVACAPPLALWAPG